MADSSSVVSQHTTTIEDAKNTVLFTSNMVLNAPKRVLFIAGRNKDILRRNFQFRLSMEFIHRLLGTHEYNKEQASKVYPSGPIEGFPSVGTVEGVLASDRLSLLNKHLPNKILVSNAAYAISHNTKNLSEEIAPYKAHQVPVMSTSNITFQSFQNPSTRHNLFNTIRFTTQENLELNLEFLDTRETIRVIKPLPPFIGKKFEVALPLNVKRYKYNDAVVKHSFMLNQEDNNNPTPGVRSHLKVLPLVPDALVVDYSKAANIAEKISALDGHLDDRYPLNTNDISDEHAKIAAHLKNVYLTTLIHLKDSKGKVTKPIIDDKSDKMLRAERPNISFGSAKFISKAILDRYKFLFDELMADNANIAFVSARMAVVCSEMSNSLFLSHLFPYVSGAALAKTGHYYTAGEEDKGVLEYFKSYSDREIAFESAKNPLSDFIHPGYVPTQLIFGEPLDGFLDNIHVLFKETKIDDIHVMRTYNHEVLESLIAQLCFGLLSPQLMFNFIHGNLTLANIGYRHVKSDGGELYYRCKPAKELNRGTSDSAAYVRIPLPVGQYKFYIDNFESASCDYDLFDVNRGLVGWVVHAVAGGNVRTGVVADQMYNNYYTWFNKERPPIINMNNKDLRTFALSLYNTLKDASVMFPHESVCQQLPYLHVLIAMMGPENIPFTDEHGKQLKEYPAWLQEINAEADILGKVDSHSFASYLMSTGYRLADGKQAIPEGSFLHTGIYLVNDIVHK